MTRQILFAFALVIASRCTVSAQIKTNRTAGAAPLARVCFLPLNAQLTRVGMGGAEPQPAESDAWAGKLRDMVRHSLAGAGLALAGDFSAPEEIANDQTRQSLLKVREKYDTIAVLLNKKPGKVSESRYSLGDEVALAPCSADADALLFVDAAGASKTGGRKAFTIITGGMAGVWMAQSNFRIAMAFADAKTGSIVAFTRITVVGNKTDKDPEGALDTRLTEEFGKMKTAAKKP